MEWMTRERVEMEWMTRERVERVEMECMTRGWRWSV